MIDQANIEQIGLGIASLGAAIYYIKNKLISDKVSNTIDQSHVDIIGILQNQRDKAYEEIEAKDKEIQKLKENLDNADDVISELKQDLKSVNNRIAMLNDLINRLTKVIELTNQHIDNNT